MNRKPIAGLILAAATLVGIAAQEGYRETAYIPVPGDVPTIGFGHTDGVRMGDKTNPVRSLQVLVKEIDGVYASAVKRCVKVPVSDNEFSVFVSLAYNLGPSRFCGSTLVKYVNQEEYGKACGQIVLFVYGPGKKPLKGLVNRRVAEYLECVKDV